MLVAVNGKGFQSLTGGGISAFFLQTHLLLFV